MKELHPRLEMVNFSKVTPMERIKEKMGDSESRASSLIK
jgi:hypothetical protein